MNYSLKEVHVLSTFCRSNVSSLLCQWCKSRQADRLLLGDAKDTFGKQDQIHAQFQQSKHASDVQISVDESSTEIY